MIRLTVPSIEDDDLNAVREVHRSGFLVQGPRVAEFEEVVARYVGVEFAVAVVNCTAALHLALLALKIQPGDKVAVATYSWPATANVIALCGAEPVFVDIDPRTFCMDPAKLEAALARTRCKAILPVHAFGGIADMPTLSQVAGRHGVPIVEDAACALGATLGGRQAGSWGTLGCYSFHPRKAITTGEGGVIVTNDPELARQLRALRNHGLDPAAPRPTFMLPGYNLRMTDFQGALGVTQMRKLERIVGGRRAGAARYDALLAGTTLTTPASLPGSRHVYQSYVVLLPAASASRRDGLIASLRAQGVEATFGTHHVPLTTWFSASGGFHPGSFPTTDDVAARALSLPLYESIAEDDQRLVVNSLLALLDQ